MNWLSDQHQLLLKSALLNSSEAIDAWNQWKSTIDLENIDYQSLRQLPMVYNNLRGRVDEDKFFNTCKGVYRRTWLANHILFNSTSDVLRAIIENNIEVLLLKGTSLILRYYNDFGLRAMGDVDFLVNIKDRKRAFKIIKGLGWTPNLQGSTWKEFIKVRFKHSLDFKKENNHIDLH